MHCHQTPIFVGDVGSVGDVGDVGNVGNIGVCRSSRLNASCLN